MSERDNYDPSKRCERCQTEMLVVEVERGDARCRDCQSDDKRDPVLAAERTLRLDWQGIAARDREESAERERRLVAERDRIERDLAESERELGEAYNDADSARLESWVYAGRAWDAEQREAEANQRADDNFASYERVRGLRDAAEERAKRLQNERDSFRGQHADAEAGLDAIQDALRPYRHERDIEIADTINRLVRRCERAEAAVEALFNALAGMDACVRMNNCDMGGKHTYMVSHGQRLNAAVEAMKAALVAYQPTPQSAPSPFRGTDLSKIVGKWPGDETEAELLEGLKQSAQRRKDRDVEELSAMAVLDEHDAALRREKAPASEPPTPCGGCGEATDSVCRSCEAPCCQFCDVQGFCTSCARKRNATKPEAGS